MFLTQTEQGSTWTRNQGTKISRTTLIRSKSQYRNKFDHLSSINSQFQLLGSRKSSSNRTFNLADFNKNAQLITPETKWNKIVDLYNLPVKTVDPTQSDKAQIKTICPGLRFYKLLATQILQQKHKLKVNFPETYLEISRDLIQVKTDSQTGELQARKIERDQYCTLMGGCLESGINKIRQFSTNGKGINKKVKQQTSIRYKEHYDFRKNSFAPVVITKIGDESGARFEVDIQNYKNFHERRSRPSNNKVVQRYIYSRNMRAMIMRICYSRKQLGEQKEEFFAYRFQNIDNIFRVNKKNNQIYQTFKAQSTISAAYDREDKIEYSKIINMRGLQKYIEPSKQLIKFLQISQKIKINQIYIDYICDLLDKPWLINIKRIQYENNNHMLQHRERMSDHKFSLHIAGSYGICRLCSIQYLKKNLKKSISNKMLCEFLSHLKKRMKVSEYEKLQFVNEIIRKNIKNYITLQVCDSCYRTVAEEYRLIESEQKLAKICNISPQLQTSETKNKCLNLPRNMKQWRLMIYFVGISNIPQQLLKQQEEVLLKYKLGNGEAAEQTWKVRASYKSNSTNFYGNFNIDLNIKKVKIHYFYSESLDISQFLKETEISLQLASVQEQKVFAKGSSGSLSCFSNQFTPGLCLRQTSSVLLFYNNGAYCQMTFKIGLTCDGLYQVGDSIALTPLNKVYFADNSFTNANAIPKQWMQAFGISRDIQVPQATYESIMKPHIEDKFIELIESNQTTTNEKQKIKNKYLARKSLHLLR